MTTLVDAFAFLTRLPFAGPRADRAPDLGRSSPWFPLVGAVIGLAAGGARALAGVALDPLPATVLAVLVPIVLTGGLHEDGLADTADALGAHVSQERRREILQDPRLGTFGTLALAAALLLAVSVLVTLDAGHFLRAVVAGHAVGRCAAVVVAHVAGSCRLSGSAARLDPGRARTALAVALVLGVAIVAAVAAAVGAGTAAVALRGLGAINGDVLGAVVKTTELATVVALAASWT